MTTRTSTSLMRSTGAPGLLVAGVPGRLPMAAYGIGLLALGRDVYGSFTVGGMLAACYTAAAILSGAVIGARIDRPGFARQLPVLAGIHLALVVVLAAVATAAAPPALVGVLTVGVGATVLPVGVITRASWTALVSVDDLGRAMLLESAADEVVFLVGPLVVTSLGGAVGPGPALVAVACATTLGVVGLARVRGALPAPIRPTAPSVRGPVPVLLLGTFLTLGWAFAAVQVAAFGTAAEAGRPGDAGWMLTVFSLVSLLSTLALGRWGGGAGGRRPHATGLAMVAAGLSVTGLAAHSPMVFTVLSAGAAAAAAPTVAAGFRRIARAARPAVLAWAAAALSAGLAIGSAVSGRLVQVAGSSAVLLVGAAAALIGAALAGRPASWERQ